jgi:hypothetical protein
MYRVLRQSLHSQVSLAADTLRRRNFSLPICICEHTDSPLWSDPMAVHALSSTHPCVQGQLAQPRTWEPSTFPSPAKRIITFTCNHRFTDKGGATNTALHERMRTSTYSLGETLRSAYELAEPYICYKASVPEDCELYQVTCMSTRRNMHARMHMYIHAYIHT